jgi:RNA polymerase primary sigma factor
MYRVSKRANALRQELGREATHAEIAEGTTLTAADVARLACMAQAAVSLDAPLAPGEGARLQDLLADEASLAPDEQMFERALSDAVAESLTSLPARESKILRLYFGLDGDGPTTLEVIGTRMGSPASACGRSRSRRSRGSGRRSGRDPWRASSRSAPGRRGGGYRAGAVPDVA